MSTSLKKAGLFVGLTFSVSYPLIYLYLALGGKWVMPGSLIVTIAYMFVPMTVAIVLQRAVYRQPLSEPLGVSFKLNRWFTVAWLLPAAMALATLGVSLLYPSVEFSSEMAGLMERLKSALTPDQFQQMQKQTVLLPIHPFWIALAQGLIAGPTVNAVAGFGEELGWRGFLQRELGGLGFWKSSALIGFIWGVWHTPIILQGHNYPQHPEVGVAMMTAFTILLAPIFSYVRIKARSVIAAAVLHGSLNATAGLAIMVVKGGDDLTTGMTGVAGFITLGVVNIAILVHRTYNRGSRDASLG